MESFRNKLLSFTFFPLIIGCTETSLHHIAKEPEPGSPQLRVEPSSIDFGEVPVGETRSETVTITSIGDSPVEVISTRIGSGEWAFSLVGPVAGDFPPGESFELSVVYSSQGSEADGKLEITSDDLDSPNISVPITSDDVFVDDRIPIAVCSVSPIEILAIHEEADWLGEGSYDPTGRTISEYRWRMISQPLGSNSALPAGGSNRSGFVPDVVGQYTAELVVVNDIGVISDPCLATLEATAGEGLWVEMFWTRSGDDMDLHLVNDGGSLGTADDCFYANCTGRGLEWGLLGAPDNPTLDLDDVPGTGPENINVEMPGSGTYTIYVHDYPYTVYYGQNDVTVNVYYGSNLIWTDTRNIDDEGCFEPFATVRIPMGIVNPLIGNCR